MSYQALYRKFRPETFSEVKGQDAIVTTLQNQIETGRIGHAYLFCGTRGTGKTTVAKIMARAVNCENPDHGEACGKCAACRAIAEGSAINVVEIDAASNNGVDNIREIREEVSYAPTSGKYKVYIIDEVHMLSPGAFNALLKTLEEPPSYVIFILATTEARKIPATILSRCQRYDFRRISQKTITDRLRELLDREGMAAEEEALSYLARQADGSMRDALSLLDQCAAFYPGEPLSYEHTLEILGAVDPSVFSDLTDALTDGDVSRALQVLDSLLEKGRDLTQFVGDYIWYLRNVLLARSMGEGDSFGEILDMSDEAAYSLRKKAKTIEPAALFRYIRVLSALLGDMRTTEQKRLYTELALIRLCRPEMETDTESLAERVRSLEEHFNGQAGSEVPFSGGISAEAGASLEERIERAEERIRKETEKKIERAVKELEKRGISRGSEPRKKPELPMAVPDDVREVIAHFREATQDAEEILKSYLKDARLSLGKSGSLLMVFRSEVAKGYVLRRIDDLSDLLAEKTGKRIRLEAEAIGSDRSFDELYVDLEKKIGIPIVVDDSDDW